MKLIYPLCVVVMILFICFWLLVYFSRPTLFDPPMAYRGDCPEPNNPVYYVGQNVRLVYSKSDGIIIATTVETYDIPPNIPEQHILNLLNSLEKRAAEYYSGNTDFGSIVKCCPHP